MHALKHNFLVSFLLCCFCLVLSSCTSSQVDGQSFSVFQEDTLIWDPPDHGPGEVSGYYLYIEESNNQTLSEFPQRDPTNYDYDVSLVTTFPLSILEQHHILVPERYYIVALSSYLKGQTELLISTLSTPLIFCYQCTGD